MKLKDLKKKSPRNPVAKSGAVNRAATHKDKKKALRDPRKNQKHKGKMFESLAKLIT